jgi:hypothetical protein
MRLVHTEEVIQAPELDAVCPLFRPCSVRRQSALPNDANQHALKSQLSGMIAGPAITTNSSSSTSTASPSCDRKLLASCGASHRRGRVRCSLRAWASPACDHKGRWRSWRRRHHGAGLGPEYSHRGRMRTSGGSSAAAANGSNHIASNCPRSPGINLPTCADDRY